MNEFVIAGADGTAESVGALDAAVDEAVLRGCPPRIARARHDQVGRVDHAAVRHAFWPVAVVPAARS